MKQLGQEIPEQSLSEICETNIVLHGRSSDASILSDESSGLSALSSEREESDGMDNGEERLFRSIIFSKIGVLPVAEAVIVGQAGKPAPPLDTLISRLFYHFPEFLEKISGIMRARGSFRMVLDGKDGILSVNHPFDGPVIEVYVTDHAFGLN
jgi:hypothetical protein